MLQNHVLVKLYTMKQLKMQCGIKSQSFVDGMVIQPQLLIYNLSTKGLYSTIHIAHSIIYCITIKSTCNTTDKQYRHVELV